MLQRDLQARLDKIQTWKKFRKRFDVAVADNEEEPDETEDFTWCD